MSFFLNDVKFLAASSGVSDFTIGVAISGFQLPASAAGFISGHTYSYSARTSAGQFESGTGVCNGVTMTRASVADGSSGVGVKVNFSNPPTVILTALASDFLDIVTDSIVVHGGGNFAQVNIDSTGSRVQSISDDGDWQFSAIQLGANAGGAGLALAKTRGASPSIHTALQNGDEIGFVFAAGSDGTAYIPAALLDFQVDGSVSSGSVPTAFVVYTGVSNYGTEHFRVSSAGSVTIAPENNTLGIGWTQYGYNASSISGSQESGFNEIFVNDYSQVPVAKAFAVFLTLQGDGTSNWGSSNSLIEKVCGNFEARVFTPPTGSPGPHQPVGLSSFARTAPGIGNSPTLELFAANFGTIAFSPVLGMIGNEYDINVDVGSGGSTTFKWGCNMGTGGANGTDGHDTAYLTGSDGVAKWHSGYSWFNNSISGDIIGPYADVAVLSCVNGINFSTVTFSGAPIIAPLLTPASSAAAGTTGSIKWDASFIYICTTTNTWKRVALSSF